MIVLVLAVYLLAAARITRLINYDQIFNPIRDAILRAFKGHYLVAYFLVCPWCVGLWVCLGTAWVPLWHADNPIAQYVGIALAASYLIGVAAPLSEDEDLTLEKDDKHA